MAPLLFWVGRIMIGVWGKHMDEESINWYYEGYMCNQWLAVTMITRYCMFWMYMSDSQSIVIQLSSLSYGAEFTIPDQQPMKSILHMIGQKLSNHNLVFQLQLLSVL